MSGVNERSTYFLLPGTRMIAVVVDDVRINRLVAGRFLRVLDAEVKYAADGREAIDAVTSADDPFDVILMDCHMPGIDGVR